MATWSSIGNLEAITFRDLYDLIQAGGALAKNALSTSQITGTEQKKAITKTELLYYVFVDQNNIYLSPKDSNRIVVKRDVSPVFVELTVTYAPMKKNYWDGLTTAQRRTAFSADYTPHDWNTPLKESDTVLAFKVQNTGSVATTGNTVIKTYFQPKWMITPDNDKVYWDQGDTTIPLQNVSLAVGTVERSATLTISDTIPAGKTVFVYFFTEFSLFGTAFNSFCNYTNYTSVSVTSPNAPTFSDANTRLIVDNFSPINVTVSTPNYQSIEHFVPINTNFLVDYYVQLVPRTSLDYWDITDSVLDVTLDSTLTYITTYGGTASVTNNPDGTKRVVVSGFSLKYLSTSQPSADYNKHIQIVVKFTQERVFGTAEAIYSNGQLCPSIDQIRITRQADYDYDPHYTSQGYSTCYSCSNAAVYKDTNVNSSTYDYYYALVGTTYHLLTQTAPANAACDYTAHYTVFWGTKCVDCTNYTVYKHDVDNYPCFTGDLYYTSENGGTTYAENPSNGGCNFAANYAIYKGQICINCTTYSVYQNDNTCFTGNQYYSTDGTTYANNPTSSACNTSQSFTSYLGSYCDGCTEYNVWKNTNSCYTGTLIYYASTNSNPIEGTALDSNPLLTNPACDFSANLVDAGFNTCASCTTYDVYKDNNTCSSTYGHYWVNDEYWGSGAPTSGDCSTTPIYTNQGYTTCYNCTTYTVYRDTNVCSATYNHYFAGSGGTDLGTTAPSSDACACCTAHIISNYTSSSITVYYKNCAGFNTSQNLSAYQGGVTICVYAGTTPTWNGASHYSTGSC